MNVVCLTPPLERAKRVGNEVVTREALNDGKALPAPSSSDDFRQGRRVAKPCICPSVRELHDRYAFTRPERIASLSLFSGRRRPSDRPDRLTTNVRISLQRSLVSDDRGTQSQRSARYGERNGRKTGG